MNPAELKAYLSGRRSLVDRELQRRIPKSTARPAALHRAMRHSMFAGGKRLRPILALAAAEACGGAPEAALPAACAVECIHTFSLIHDDLPCMDDDDFRRGVPTCHKVFGEGIAVLAGDALQALAFEILASADPTKRYPSGAFVRELAAASGSRHLIAGQILDLEGEGKKLTRSQLRQIHERKTAALLAASVRLGGMSADAPPEKIARLDEYGMALGLAFQIIDDILDETQSSEQLGKTAGKDAAAGKATYPAVVGMDAARREAARLTAKAIGAARAFPGAPLVAIAEYLLGREY